MRHDSISTAMGGLAEIREEGKDLLPAWPNKTRKRRSSSSSSIHTLVEEPFNLSLNSSSSWGSWSFMDLPPKKRILLVVEARRVEQQYMCFICGRVYEDYHALGGHKSHHN